VGILAKVLLFGFAAFWALGVLLYVMAPMLWHFIRHRLTNHDRRKSRLPDRPLGGGPENRAGNPNNERRYRPCSR